MAAGGGVTTAYKCWVVAEQMFTQHTSRLRSECVKVDDAVARLGCGETVVVAGSDMAALRTRLAGLGIGQAPR